MLVAATVLGLASPAVAETIEQALARAYANNPQLNAQRAILRQADEGVPQALSGYRPNVSANASVGREYTDIKQVIPPTPPFLTTSASFAAKGLSTPRSVGATVSQTLFNGQQTANRVRARANVVKFWGQLQAAKAQIEAAQRQNDAAERALTGVRNEALAGQRTTQDVLIAEQALVNARQSLIVAQHDKVVASYSLLSAVGRLSAQTLGLPVPTYDPVVHYQQVRDSWVGLRIPSGE